VYLKASPKGEEPRALGQKKILLFYMFGKKKKFYVFPHSQGGKKEEKLSFMYVQVPFGFP
jgi:hypothetical protein